MPAMGDYVLYKALQSYVSSASDELQFQKDDVFQISVESPYTENASERAGFLHAYNRRTGEEGYVPIKLVKLLGSAVNNTIHHPSAPGIAASNVMPGIYFLIIVVIYKFLKQMFLEPTVKLKCNHQFKEAYFLRPVFCQHCKYFVY